MMKKILISLLKAMLYIGVFLGIQIAVTLIVSLFFALVGDIMIYSMGISDPDSILMANLLPTVTVLSGWITLLFLWMMFAVRGKSFSREVRWHKMIAPWRASFGPLVCGFGLSLAASCAIASIPLPTSWYDAFDESTELLMTGNPLFLAAAVVFVGPILEEVIFRGLIYTRLCRGMPCLIAALLSSVLFGLVHGTLLHMLYTVPMGLLLCLFYEKYRSLWAPIILHMSFNLAGTALGYYVDLSLGGVIVLLVIGLYLTVFGLLSMRWYRRETGLYSKPQKAEMSTDSDLPLSP